MKLAVISDVHGNEVALQNCLRYLREREVQKLYFLGDAIGYMPNGAEVIDLLQQYECKCLKGNHEAMVLGTLELDEKRDEVYKLRASADRLSENQISMIETWSQSHEESIDGLNYLMVHGSPANPLTGYLYPDSNLEEIETVAADVIIMGHSHYPFIRKQGDKTVLNVGSVGLPRDVGNLSSLCVIDTKFFSVEHIRIPFSAREVWETAKGDIHRAVWDCFERRADNYIGSINN